MLRPEGMNISDNPWISQVEKGIIDGEAASGGGMENGEFCIFDSSPEEVGDRVCASMEGDGVEGGVF